MPLGLQSVIFGKTTYWVELKISAVSCTECTQTSKHRDQKSLLGSVQMQTKVREPLQKWQNSTFRCVWCGHSSTGWGGREGLTESCLRQGFSLLCWFSSSYLYDAFTRPCGALFSQLQQSFYSEDQLALQETTKKLVEEVIWRYSGRDVLADQNRLPMGGHWSPLTIHWPPRQYPRQYLHIAWNRDLVDGPIHCCPGDQTSFEWDLISDHLHIYAIVKFRKWPFLVNQVINPYAKEWEAERIFPAHKVFKKFGQAGLLGIHRSKILIQTRQMIF